MPGFTSNASPYPKVADVMNLARVRVNDCANDITGELLADDQPYTLTMLNSAWRWLQTKAAVAGVETFIREESITGFPMSLIPGSQCNLGWGGCNVDGNQYANPALPYDLILPLKIWSQQTAIGSFCEMRMADGPLPSWNNQAFLDPWLYEWREDGIYFFGVNYARDLRIRYSAVREDLNFSDPLAKVPMMFCQDALSARIAYEFANARGAVQAPALMQMAEDAFALISQRTSRKNERKSVRRMSYSGRY